jgi:DNA-directed RNA polymerase II subunit RPB2
MIKLDESSKSEKIKVEVYVGGKNGDKIYLDRPVILDKEGNPTLLSPQDARLRNLTYSTKLFADIEIVYTKEKEPYDVKEFKQTLLGSIPLMLHSDQCMLNGQGSKVLRGLGECHMDPGGYFIIDGKEKVIISQERITTNRLFVSHVEDEDDDFSLRGYIRCTGKGETALSPRTVEIKVVRTKCFTQYINVNEHGMQCYNNQKPTEKYMNKQGTIYVSLPSIAGLVPLAIAFRALGIETDKAIIEAICGPIDNVPIEFQNFLRPSLADAASKLINVFTLDEAHNYLQMRTNYKSIQQVKSILTQDVFPNIEGSIHQKGMYLGYLVSIIMKTSLNMMPPSDRDGYVFKRVDISGILLAQLFQETYSRFRKDVRNILDQEYNYGPIKNDGNIEKLVDTYNLHRVFNSGIITDVFARSLKGAWGPPQDDPEQGLVQDLSRISYIGFMSHLRRVNMPLDRSIKITSPHRLHPQQWGVMCPFESPDGASIGYLKNFALMTQITSGCDEKDVYHILEELGAFPLNTVSPIVAADKKNVKIFVNGSWYGITEDPHTTCRAFRLYRRNGLINPFISVAWNIQEGEIRIQTEPGRPCRPLLLTPLKQIPMNITWFDMIYGSLLSESDRNAKKYVSDEYISPYSYFPGESLSTILESLEKTQCFIEYLDIEEENTMYVAMTKDDITPFHTHVEIHPSTVFSIVTQIVPFANHNQGPRVIFHAAQSKQALGIYATNFNQRFDTNGYIHHYPQKRLVTTRGSHYNGNDRMPNGTNVIVAIATYSGYNQEDSIMINKTSIDRGLFQITGYKTMVASEKTLSPTERVVFANPTVMRDEGKDIPGIKHANYTLLDKNGIISENSYIPRGQDAIIMGMVNVRDKVKDVQRGVLMYKETEQEYKDVSLKSDVHNYGNVDKVFVGHPTPGNPDRICKVKFRKVRRPELGDKHCSAHGQKGVVGMIISQENMPFTKDGIVPDLIINPHAFPSRMTMGHLVETVMAKVCCLEGVTGDGTVFIPFDKEELYNNLESHNYQRHGNEIMYNGRTGEQIKSEIFIGPIYYYRLKHMVADKIHSRSTGAKTQLTHQPTSGRSAGGGLRIGEMERDVLLGHGIAQFAKECMMEKSDKYKWAVCRHCGTVAKFSASKFIAECTGCKKQDIAVVQTPYSFKLLIQEMEGMGIQMRLSTQEKIRDDDTYNDTYDDTYDEIEDDNGPITAYTEYELPEHVYPEPPIPPPMELEPLPQPDDEEEYQDSELESDVMFAGGFDDADASSDFFEGGSDNTSINEDGDEDADADIINDTYEGSQDIGEKLDLERSSSIIQPPSQKSGGEVKVINVNWKVDAPNKAIGGGDGDDEDDSQHGGIDEDM